MALASAQGNGRARMRALLGTLERPAAYMCMISRLPRRLGFSYMCAAQVPVALAVGSVPQCLSLMPRRYRVQCDVSVVCWLDAVEFEYIYEGYAWSRLPMHSRNLGATSAYARSVQLP